MMIRMLLAAAVLGVLINPNRPTAQAQLDNAQALGECGEGNATTRTQHRVQQDGARVRRIVHATHKKPSLLSAVVLIIDQNRIA